MSQYNSLKATIDDNITTNGNQEITGAVLNSVLKAMVDSLGAGYKYAGIATPTSPGTDQSPDGQVFYIATTPGTYSHLGNLVVNDGEVAVLKWDSSWHKDVSGAATKEDVDSVRNILNISQMFPDGGEGGTNVYTRTTARAKITAGSGKRREGCILTYLTADGWVLEQFVGQVSQWSSPYWWRDLTDGCSVFVVTKLAGETRQDARNKVLLKNQKTGAIVCYKDGDTWCFDQFISDNVGHWSSNLYLSYWRNLLVPETKDTPLSHAAGLADAGISVTGTPGERGAVYSMNLRSSGLWVLSFKFKYPKDVQQGSGVVQLAKFDNLASNAKGGFCLDILKATPTAQAPFAQPYFGAGLNWYPVAQKTNNYASRYRPTGAANRQFTGEDAISIRYAGDISVSANRDVVLTIDDTGLVVKHSTDNSVIVSEAFPQSKSMNEFAATLASKTAAGGVYNGIIEFEFLIVEEHSTDDLLRVSNIPLVGDYSSQSASKGWQAFPCFLPYYDDSWHQIDIRMDWSKSDIRNALVCLYDGMEMSTTSALATMEGDGKFVADFTLGGEGILVKDLKFKNGVSETDSPKIVVCMTHQQTDGVYDPHTTDGYMTLGRMQWIMSVFKEYGFEFVGLEQIASYIAAGASLPRRCFTIIFDDKYYLADWTNPLASKFRQLLMANCAQASFAIAPSAIDTQAKIDAINADKSIFQFHAHDTTNPTADKYGYAEFMSHYRDLFASHRNAIGATNIYTYAGGKYDVNLLHLFRHLGISYCSLVGGNYMSFVNSSGTASLRRTNTFTAKAFDALSQPRLSIDDDDITEELMRTFLGFMTSI